MTLQEELMDIGKERLTQMKVLLDELQVQMALGKSEAKDIFERERKNFQQFVSDEKSQLRRNGEAAGTHRKALEHKLSAFRTQLGKQVGVSEKQYEPQKKHTLHAIYELEMAMKEAWGDVGMGLQTKIDAFKIKLDDYRIKLALGDFEKETELEPLVTELKDAMASIEDRLGKEVGASKKIETFSEEFSLSFDHMKKAFSELLS